jgi:hypothetical protein
LTSEATRTPGNASRATVDRPGAGPSTGRNGTIAPASARPRPVIDTPSGRFEFAPHHCFACGTLNAGGLGLDLHVEPGRSWVELALEPRFEGWEGVVHGGILCAILDEVMAWALVGEDNWGVTARMAVDFRKALARLVPVFMPDLLFRVKADSNAKFFAESRYHYVFTSPIRTTVWPVTFGFRR